MATKTKTTKTKTHPADVINIADLAKATKFSATLFRGSGQFDKAEADTLVAIRAKAHEMEKAAGPNARKAIVHALVDGRAIPIPAKYDGKPIDPAKAGTKPAALMEVLKGGRAAWAGVAAKITGNAVDPATSAAARKAEATAAEKKAPAAKKAAAKKPAAKAKAAPKAKAAKPAKEGPSKTDTVIKMLRKGATRAAIVEATGWQVDLKALAARKGLKLKKNADGVITATGGE